MHTDDLDFLRRAYQVAAEHSYDPHTQNGAVIVRDGRIVTAAANGLPAGIPDTPDRWLKPGKYQYVEHAERMAIYLAARNGVPTDGCTMYCPWAPCVCCARAIIECGIVELVAHADQMERTASHWRENVEVGLRLLQEAGVRVRHISGHVGGVEILFDGQAITP